MPLVTSVRVNGWIENVVRDWCEELEDYVDILSAETFSRTVVVNPQSLDFMQKTIESWPVFKEQFWNAVGPGNVMPDNIELLDVFGETVGVADLWDGEIKWLH